MPARIATILSAILVVSGVLAAQPASLRPYLVPDAGGHTAAVNKVIFTPDGQRLVTVSNDKTIRIWDVSTGESLKVLRPPIGNGSAGMLYALAISPRGDRLAAAGYEYPGEDHGIYLIDLAKFEIEKVLRGHTNVILDLAFSADGRWLGSASADKTARLWDLKSLHTHAVCRGHREGVYAVAFSPDGAALATASLDHTPRLWSVKSGSEQAVLRGHTSALQAIAWSPNAEMIATGCNDQSINLSSASGKLMRRYERLGNHVTSLSFTREGRELFFTLGGPGDKDGGYFVDVKSNRERLSFTQHQNSVLAGCLSPDNMWAATADANGEICLWQMRTGTILHRLKSQSQRPWSAAWTRDGESIAWGNSSDYRDPNHRGPLEFAFELGELDFTDLPQANLLRAQNRVGTVSVQPVDDRTLSVRRPGQAATRLVLENAYDQVRCFTLLDENAAAIGSDFGLFLYDARNGRRIRSLQGHAGAIWAIAPSANGQHLLSAADDQTLSIWAPQASEPLLSFFFAGRQWIAWTREGYYAASPGGERLMGWHLNQGRDRLGTFFPAAHFRDSLYRPDVIKKLLSAGSVPAALAEIDAEAERPPGQPTRIEQVLPPQVRITQPKGPLAEASELQLLIRATAQSRSEHPITALRLLIDGRPQEGQKGVQVVPIERPESSAEAKGAWTVQIAPGRHALVVQAETAASKGLSEPVELLVREPDVASASALPNLYVFAVGIAAYPEPLKLAYADQDARVLTSALQASSTPLFQKVNVRLLTNEQATRKDILAGLTWLRREATQRDVSVFYYSGHGAKDEGGNFYFVPIDGAPADLLATCVSGSQFKDALSMIPGRVVVLLDACHAGAASGDKRKAALSLTDDLVRDLVTDDYGAVMMCSSMGREFSMESDEHKQGYFTLALVEALSGKADYNRDGFVYLTEVDAYLSDRIKTLTQGQQHPVTTKPATIRSFPLSKPSVP